MSVQVDTGRGIPEAHLTRRAVGPSLAWPASYLIMAYFFAIMARACL